MGVHDLNFRLSICDHSGFDKPRVRYERGQDTVCASYRVRAMEDLWTHHRPTRRRCGSTHLGLRRFVSRDGVLAIDLCWSLFDWALFRATRAAVKMHTLLDLHLQYAIRYPLKRVRNCQRGAIPTDEALLKLFYLAMQNISRKWTMPIRDWKAAFNRFTIQFEERMPQH